MKAHICVDYLSYDWTAPELVRAHREIHCQMAATTMKRKLSQSVPPINTRTKQNKLVRLQNALWRQMARTCTPHLSKDNPMVDPSVVNWQKESDITWLFGPLFSDDPPPSLSIQSSHAGQSGLKSALKKRKLLSTSHSLDDHLDLMLPLDTNHHAIFEQPEYRPWSKCSSDPGTASSSGVRFNPKITRFKYLPELPVSEPFEQSELDHSKPYFRKHHEDAPPEEALWTLLWYLKDSTVHYIANQAHYRWLVNLPLLAMASMSLIKSITSFTTTWFIASLIWAIKRSLHLQKRDKKHNLIAYDRVAPSSDNLLCVK